MKTLNIGFELERLTISIDRILPVRIVKDPDKKVRRYREIVSTIKEVGLVEPLMVYPEKGNTGNYLLTDGHLRLAACKELGIKTVECIVSLDDESYTYNAKVNRLAPIQERNMILKAVENGLSIEKIAAALNVDVSKIRASLNVTSGLCEEVVEKLKDKQMSPMALKALRSVLPARQIEISELMVAANNFTKAYVEALLLGTPKNMLKPKATKPTRRIKPEELAQMELEMESLGMQYKACESVFSEKVLQLTVIRRYMMRLLDNPKINRFVKSRHAEIHAELAEIIASETVC